MGTHAMKRVAAGAHLPISWLFEPAKLPDESRLLPGLQFHHQVFVFTQDAPYGRTVVRAARPNEHSQRIEPPSNAD